MQAGAIAVAERDILGVAWAFEPSKPMGHTSANKSTLPNPFK